MIIDLCGLPASGKSFFSREFCKVYKEKNEIVFHDFILFDRNSFIGKVWHTLAYSFIRKSNKYKKLINLLTEFAKGKPKLNADHSLSFFAQRIIFLKINYLLAKKLHFNMFVNEGISQSLVVLAVEFSLSNEQFLNLVVSIIPESIDCFVYGISIKDCISEFKKRNRHITFIDELEGEQLLDFLNNFKKYLDMLQNNKRFTILRRDNGFDRNYRRVIESEKNI